MHVGNVGGTVNVSGVLEAKVIREEQGPGGEPNARRESQALVLRDPARAYAAGPRQVSSTFSTLTIPVEMSRTNTLRARMT